MSEPILDPILTRSQLRGALSVAGLKPGDYSPILGLLGGEETSMNELDWRALHDIGWLDTLSPPHLTPLARGVLQALCSPQMTVSLLLGTGDAVYRLQFYSAEQFAGADLMSVVADPEGQEFAFMLNQDFAMVADLLMAQLLVGEMDVGVEFKSQLSKDAFVALLAYIDWRLQAILNARLDRLTDPDPAFRPMDAWQALVEGRTADDLNWVVTQFTYLIPFLDFNLDQGDLEAAFADLRSQNLILPSVDGRLIPADLLLELADGLVPILSFAAISVETLDEHGQPTRTHLAFLRGRQASLLVQPATGSDGDPLLHLDSLDGIELGEMLFMMGLPEQRIIGTPTLEPPTDQTILIGGWRVTITQGPEAGSSVTLGPRTTLGRGEDNQIRLQDVKISRNHAVIEMVGFVPQITDLESGNGTYVNNQPVQGTTSLQDGDTIGLGDVCLEVHRPLGLPEPALITCSACSAPVKSGHRFCTRCGAQVSEMGGDI